jgi:hypothetical protein
MRAIARRCRVALFAPRLLTICHKKNRRMARDDGKRVVIAFLPSASRAESSVAFVLCLPKTLSGMTRGWAYRNEAADGHASLTKKQPVARAPLAEIGFIPRARGGCRGVDGKVGAVVAFDRRTCRSFPAFGVPPPPRLVGPSRLSGLFVADCWPF